MGNFQSISPMNMAWNETSYWCQQGMDEVVLGVGGRVAVSPETGRKPVYGYVIGLGLFGYGVLKPEACGLKLKAKA